MVKNNIIHITCALDSKYTRFAAVLLVSIFENNKNERFCCHIMGLDLSEENKQDIVEITERYNNDVRFYAMHKELFQEFPVSSQWNYLSSG